MQQQSPIAVFFNAILHPLNQVRFILVYSAVALYLSYHSHNIHLIPYDYYFIFVIVLFTAASFLFRDKSKSSDIPISEKQFLIFGAFAFYLLYARVSFLEVRPIWLDEHFQGVTALINSPLYAGAIQHQPPLDIIFMHMAFDFFGINAGALRFHSFLFSFLGGLLVWRLAFRLSASSIFSTVCGFIFCEHLIIVKYGFEARPISLGIYGYLLLTEATILAAENKAELKNLFTMTAASLIGLLGLGLQPPFFLAALSLLLTTTALIRRKFYFFKMALAPVIAVILFLPLQYFILQKAPARFSKLPEFSFSDILGKINLESFSLVSDAYNPYYAFTQGIFILILAAIVLRRKYLKKWFNPKQFELFAYFCLVSNIFLLLLVPFFQAYVDWALQDYYLIFIWPGILLSGAALVGWLLSVSKKKTMVLVACSAVFLSLWPQSYHFDYNLLVQKVPREDVKSVYEVLSKITTEKDVIVRSCLNYNGKHCPNQLIGGIFYYDGPAQQAGTEPYEGWLIKYLDSPHQPEHIYMIFQSYWSQKPLNMELLRLGFFVMETWQFERITLLKILVKRNKLEDIKQYFIHLAGKFPDPIFAGSEILQPIVIASLLSNDRENFEKYYTPLLSAKHSYKTILTWIERRRAINKW